MRYTPSILVRTGWRFIALLILPIFLATSCTSGGKNGQAAAGSSSEVKPAEVPGDLHQTDSPATIHQADSHAAIYTDRDREILEQMLEELAPYHSDPAGALVARAGRLFLETPYEAHTLEREEEVLVVNLRGVDCTTYAEYCLAIARTVRAESPSFDRFLDELQGIRYRDGKLDGYPSRLHYFCDWIRNNAEKGVISECAADLGGIPLGKTINFMSTHPQSYSRLEQDPGLVERIREQEVAINGREMVYIPEAMLEGVEGNPVERNPVERNLVEGDIVGITTDIEGLAVMHVGILLREEGRIHLMHASSTAGRVVISEEPLSGYLKKSERATGIMVARPL